MKHFHLKKCPLCGQSLRKTKGKLYCERCQIEIKGDTLQMNSPAPPEWERS